MAFCNQCGVSVGAADSFCGNCGAPQLGAVSATQQAERERKSRAKGGSTGGDGGPFNSLDNTTAAMLCYIPFLGWIACIVVLATDKFSKEAETRFHAFQGLYLFVAWLVYDWVLEPVLWSISARPEVITRLLKLAVVGTCVYMMYQTRQRRKVKLPWIGDLAETSVAEQR
jgi:uncharacterized membrane protein